MYERHHEPLISREMYLRRIARSGGLASAAVLAALFLGVSGYHWIEGLPWVDSILNAAMILGGWGRSRSCTRRRESCSPPPMRSSAG